jgi:aldose sugar dehydrogenase
MAVRPARPAPGTARPPALRNRYRGWKNSLFLSALAGQRLIRYEIKGRKVVREEVVFKGFGRVRWVIAGPDGLLYVLIQNR